MLQVLALGALLCAAAPSTEDRPAAEAGSEEAPEASNKTPAYPKTVRRHAGRRLSGRLAQGEGRPLQPARA